MEIHVCFPLNGTPREFLSQLPLVCKIPIPSPRMVYLPGDRVVVQGPGLGITSLQEIKGPGFNSWEQGEGSQEGKQKIRRN